MFSMSSSSGLSSSMRFCTAVEVGHRRLAALDHLRQAGLGGLVAVRREPASAPSGCRRWCRIWTAAPADCRPATCCARGRCACAACSASEKMPTKVSQPVKLFMLSNSVPNTLVASSSPMIRSAMLPSITFCCLMHVLDAGVLDVEIGGADLLVGLGELCRARCRTARSWSASPRRPAWSWQSRHRNSAVSPYRCLPASASSVREYMRARIAIERRHAAGSRRFWLRAVAPAVANTCRCRRRIAWRASPLRHRA